MTNDKSRSALKILLNADIKACRRCEGMNENGVTQSAPGWGNLDSPVAIVGQSLCEQCMAPQEPFYEGSGSLLEAAFKLADCDKQDLFLTNAVHCHPGGNRKSLVVEIANCSSYLYRELEIVRPRLVLALGEDAARALLFLYPTARKVLSRFEPPKNLRSTAVPYLYLAKHPSWVKRQHDGTLEKEYVTSLAEALKWAIDKGPRRIAPNSP